MYKNKFQPLVQESAIFRRLRFPLLYALVCMKAIDEDYATWFRFPSNRIFMKAHQQRFLFPLS